MHILLLISICVLRLWLTAAIQTGQRQKGKDSPAPRGLHSYQARWPVRCDFFFPFLFNRSSNCVAGWEHTGMAALAVEGKPRSSKYQTGSSSKDCWFCSGCCVMLNSSVPEVDPVLAPVLTAADGEKPQHFAGELHKHGFLLDVSF